MSYTAAQHSFTSLLALMLAWIKPVNMSLREKQFKGSSRCSLPGSGRMSAAQSEAANSRNERLDVGAE